MAKKGSLPRLLRRRAHLHTAIVPLHRCHTTTLLATSGPWQVALKARGTLSNRGGVGTWSWKQTQWRTCSNRRYTTVSRGQRQVIFFPITITFIGPKSFCWDIIDVTLECEDSHNLFKSHATFPCLASFCQFWPPCCWHWNKTKMIQYLWYILVIYWTQYLGRICFIKKKLCDIDLLELPHGVVKVVILFSPFT